MPLTRRKFLRIFALPISGSIIGLLLIWRWKPWLLKPIQDIYNNTFYPTLEKVGTGSLNPQTKQSLLKVTETLVGTSIEIGHYEMYFEWRAENLPGYNNLYETFVANLNELARQLSGRDFDRCDLTISKIILSKFFPSNRFNTLKRVLFNKKDYILFHDYIIREILKIFSRTDAWILLGYKYWPGEARGLEQYKKRPF